MKICLFCFSESGASLAIRLCSEMNLERNQVHSIAKYADKYGFTPHKSVCADVGTLFENNDALVFIGACGIAVRSVAPYLKNKMVDPAVIVLDDQGRFVIPVLSGHIGGANALAREIADRIGALAVITTATDGAGRFSCDAWATTHGCAISSMKLAKDISAEILNHDIPVSSEYELPKLPEGLTRGEEGDAGIFIGIHERTPYKSTLRLIPRIVTIGIGCRRGVSGDVVFSVVNETLKSNNIDLRSVCQIASIDVKREEGGLLELANRLNVPMRFFDAAQLNAVPGEFEESEFVRKTVGTGNVCERAAVLAGGRLIVGKRADNGVTVAVSEKEWRVEF